MNKEQPETNETKDGQTNNNVSSEKEANSETTTIDVKEAEEYQQLNDKYLRLAAEFENFKKRSAREYSRLAEIAESNLILQLLEVVDDFDRALSHAAEDLNSFNKGAEMIFSKLTDILKRRGLKEIKALDEQFDPMYHEAVMQKEVDDRDDDVVIEEVQKGYFLNGRVLRPAKVVVAKRKIEKDDDRKRKDKKNK